MVKIQALADFVIECTINNQEVGGQEEIPHEAREQCKHMILKDCYYWILYFDGASKTKVSASRSW